MPSPVPSPLPRALPTGVGVDADGILAFVDAVEGAGLEQHGLMVLRHGQVVTEGWWHPFGPARPHRLHSLSKSFTSTALAFAVAEGLVDLDDTVLSHFPEYDADVTDERSRRMKVRHIAAMASGHLEDTYGAVLEAGLEHPVRDFLLIPPDREPGTVFAYNQSCTFTLAAIVQRHSGQPLTEYLRSRLFDRIGIGPVGWETLHPDRQPPRNIGFSGMYATTEDIARLGQLYLREGEWDGEPVLSPEWVRTATRAHVDNASPDAPDPDSDWQQGYCFQFWRSRHGYRGDGAFGQFVVVLPAQDAVVAITAATEDMQAVLDILWRTLLPALDAGAGSDTADQRLAERLSTLAIPPAPGSSEAPAGAGAGRFVRRPEPGAAQPGLSEARLERCGPGWELTLVEDGVEVVVPVGDGSWAVAERDLGDGGRPLATATSGGWQPDGSLHAEVLFLETPHRLYVDLVPGDDGADGVVEVRWNIPSLRGGRLTDFRCPV